MVLRQIRQNAKDVIDGTIDPARELGGGFGRLVKKAGESWCDLYSKSPQFVFNSPAGGFAQGALNQICENREGFEPPSAVYDDPGGEPIPFSGGQCEGDTYLVRCDGQDNDSSAETRTFQLPVEGLTGPITSIRKFWRQESPDSGIEFGLRVVANGQTVENNRSVSPPRFDGEVLPWSLEEGTFDVSFYFFEDTIEVINQTNPSDNCGDPDPPPPEERWDDPDPDPPEVNIDIDIDYPDNYVNFPAQTINLTYNQDNRTYEGDKFVIKLELPDLIFEYDDTDPPNFLPEGLSDWWDNRPQFDPRQFLPDGLGDVFPTPGEFWRDVFDRIADLIPSPLPGVSVGDLLDAIEGEEGETEEPIDLTLTVSQCVEGEIVEEEVTFSILPSQEQIFRQLVSTRNRAEEINCRVQPFEAVKVSVVQDTFRGQARFGDSPQQTRKFFGWLQFTKQGEMIGDEILIRYDPQIIPYNKDADSYLIQAIDGAELDSEVIPLNQESE